MAKKHSTEKAVLYLRRSTDRQESSIQDQRSELTRYAGDHGYEILREYVDDAISGDRTEDRDGFLSMRGASADRKFSVILAWDQDRFGRFDILDAGEREQDNRGEIRRFRATYLRLLGVPVPCGRGTVGTMNAKPGCDASYAKSAGNGQGTRFSTVDKSAQAI